MKKTQEVFEDIVKKAGAKKPDEETLKVLLKLHECNPNTLEVVNFREKSIEEIRKLKRKLSNYITYDGSCF